MMSDCNELTITVAVPNYEQFDIKPKQLYLYYCNIINYGSMNLGLQTEVAQAVKSPDMFARQDCFVSIDPGDMCTVSSGLKFSAGTYLVSNGNFQLDMVININSNSNVAPYLETPETGFASTSIEGQLGRSVSNEDVIEAYKQAFFEYCNMYEWPLNDREHAELQALADTKYLTDEWIFKKWLV